MAELRSAIMRLGAQFVTISLTLWIHQSYVANWDSLEIVISQLTSSQYKSQINLLQILLLQVELCMVREQVLSSSIPFSVQAMKPT